MHSRKGFSNLNKEKGVIRSSGILTSGKEAFGGLDPRTTVVQVAATYLICLKDGQRCCEAIARIREDTGLSLEAINAVVESRLLPKFLLQKIVPRIRILSSNQRKTVIPYLTLLAQGQNNESAKREVAANLDKHPDLLQEHLKDTIRKILSNLTFDSASFEANFL